MIFAGGGDGDAGGDDGDDADIEPDDADIEPDDDDCNNDGDNVDGAASGSDAVTTTAVTGKDGDEVRYEWSVNISSDSEDDTSAKDGPKGSANPEDDTSAKDGPKGSTNLRQLSGLIMVYCYVVRFLASDINALSLLEYSSAVSTNNVTQRNPVYTKYAT